MQYITYSYTTYILEIVRMNIEIYFPFIDKKIENFNKQTNFVIRR